MSVNVKANKETLIEHNKREFYRIELVYPIATDAYLYQVNGNSFNKSVGKLRVTNISAGGMLFYSPLKLPITNQFIYKFKTVINYKEYNLSGIIIRNEVVENGDYRYAVKFMMPKAEQSELLADLHHLALYNKKNVKYKDRFLYFSE